MRAASTRAAARAPPTTESEAGNPSNAAYRLPAHCNQRHLPPQPALGEHVPPRSGEEAFGQEQTAPTHTYPAEKDKGENPEPRLTGILVVLHDKGKR